jgi:hypothetical protein
LKLIKRHPGLANFISGWRLACLVACLFWVGCHKPAASAPVVINSEVSPQPVRVGPVTITMKISDFSAKPVTGAHIQLEGDMSHPGMAPVMGETKEIESGRYQGVLQLNMAGDWVVLAHVILADGRKLEPQINVSGVQAN